MTKTPLLFVGHGSPMNAIEENRFVAGWREVAKSVGKPAAILCISAHWETKGTFVTAMQNPKTIHDFGGFPKELYNIQYPAPGSPEFAKETKELVKYTNIEFDHEWGLDHGCWSVIRHMYPLADVPVFQMSLDYYQQGRYHSDLAGELRSLRERGVLIIGSGNIVHNLRMVDWNNPDSGYDWALEADEGIKKLIINHDFDKLTRITEHSQAFRLAVPTPEHFNPLLYIMGLREKEEEISFFNEGLVMGSIAMTSLRIG